MSKLTGKKIKTSVMNFYYFNDDGKFTNDIAGKGMIGILRPLGLSRQMDYKKFGNSVYVRFDKNDEILSRISDICKKEKILSITYSGIAYYSEVANYILEKGSFQECVKTSALDMVSLTGNIFANENNEIFQHAHAIFLVSRRDGETSVTSGYLLEAVILYTGEIVINPVIEGVTRRMQDPITGIIVWKL